MCPEITTIVLSVLAIAFAVVAYMKDPELPWVGARNGRLTFPVIAGWLVKTYDHE